VPTYSELTSLTREHYLPKVSINFGNQTPFLKMCRAKNSTLSGGSKIVKTVAYQYTKGKAYGRGETIDVSGEQNTTLAKWTYRYYDWPITITRQDQLEINGEAQVHDLIKTKMNTARYGAEQMLARHLFQGTGTDSTKEIYAMDTMLEQQDGSGVGVLGVTATYGEIDKNTDTWWSGNVKSFLGNAHGPTYRNIQSAWALAHDSDIHPTLILMGNGSYDAFMASHVAVAGSGTISNQIFTNENDLTAGFRRTTFNGVPVLADGSILESATETANRVYGLNMDYFAFYTHEDENFRMEDWAKPIDQNMLVSHILWAGNVVTWDPSRHFVGYNFDFAATAD